MAISVLMGEAKEKLLGAALRVLMLDRENRHPRAEQDWAVEQADEELALAARELALATDRSAPQFHPVGWEITPDRIQVVVRIDYPMTRLPDAPAWGWAAGIVCQQMEQAATGRGVEVDWTSLSIRSHYNSAFLTDELIGEARPR